MKNAPPSLAIAFMLLNAALAGGFAGTARFIGRGDWLQAIPFAFLTSLIMLAVVACNLCYRAGYRDGKAKR